MKYTKNQLKDLEYMIIGAAIEVHKHLGPGLLESTYHKCMEIEMASKGLNFVSEMNVPLLYKGKKLDTNLRCDLFIEGLIALELKSVDCLAPIFNAQLLTYMKLLKCPKGLLINFNCLNIVKEGRRSLVNEIFAGMR